jgi:hypothetical protein
MIDPCDSLLFAAQHDHWEFRIFVNPHEYLLAMMAKRNDGKSHLCIMARPEDDNKAWQLFKAQVEYEDWRCLNEGDFQVP